MKLFILTLWDAVRVRDNILKVLVPVRGAIRGELLFTQQMVIEHLLCARP